MTREEKEALRAALGKSKWVKGKALTKAEMGMVIEGVQGLHQLISARGKESNHETTSIGDILKCLKTQ